MASLLFQAVASLTQPQASQQHNKHRHHLLQAKSLSFCRPSSGFASPFSIQHCSSVNSSFNGQGQSLAGAIWAAASEASYLRPVVTMSKPAIQFIRGVDEMTVPDVQLTRSRDGTNGVATFLFEQPSVFDSSGELGDITGLYLLDEEGILQSVDVSAKFVNGKPAKIEAKYLMRTQMEWDRFMRFMERYGEANGLGFVKK